MLVDAKQRFSCRFDRSILNLPGVDGNSSSSMEGMIETLYKIFFSFLPKYYPENFIEMKIKMVNLGERRQMQIFGFGYFPKSIC